MNAEQMKREFLEHTEIERGRAVKTIENYDHYLSRFLEQMQILNVPSQVAGFVGRVFMLFAMFGRSGGSVL